MFPTPLGLLNRKNSTTQFYPRTMMKPKVRMHCGHFLSVGLQAVFLLSIRKSNRHELIYRYLNSSTWILELRTDLVEDPSLSHDWHLKNKNKTDFSGDNF